MKTFLAMVCTLFFVGYANAQCRSCGTGGCVSNQCFTQQVCPTTYTVVLSGRGLEGCLVKIDGQVVKSKTLITSASELAVGKTYHHNLVIEKNGEEYINQDFNVMSGKTTEVRVNIPYRVASQSMR